MKTRPIATCAIALIALTVWPLASVADGGTLDESFGRSGISVEHATSFPGAYERAGRLRVDAAGRSVFAVQSGRRILIERRLADGHIDLGFGVAGRVSLDIDGLERSIVDLEIVQSGPQAGGLAILSTFGDSRCTITRLDVDGDLLATFGTGGSRIVLDAVSDSEAACVDLALDVAAPIVAAIVPSATTSTDAALIAFDDLGAVRNGFGNAGRLVFSVGSTAQSQLDFDRPHWLSLTGQGILVSGTTRRDFQSSVWVARLDPASGAFDATFSEDGVWIGRSNTNALTTTAWSENGETYLLAPLFNQSAAQVWKLRSDGTQETGFGNLGSCSVSLPVGTWFTSNNGQGVILDGNSRLLAILGARRSVDLPDPNVIVAVEIERATCLTTGGIAPARIIADEEPFASSGHLFAGAATQGPRVLVGGVVGLPRVDASLHAFDRTTGESTDVAIGERIAFIDGPIPSFDSALAVGLSGSGTVIAGITGKGFNVAGLYAIRLDASGRRDLSFGNAGSAVVQLPPERALTFAAALVRGNDVLLGGTLIRANPGVAPSGIDDPYGAHLYRLLPSGMVDSTFGGTGVVAPPTGSAATTIVALADDSESILMLSRAANGEPPASILHRLGPDGSLVSGFGNGGTLRFALGGADPADRLDAVTANDKAIYVAGVDPSAFGRVILRAYTRGGVPLPGFANQGRLVVSVPRAFNSAPVALGSWGDQLLMAVLTFDGGNSELAVIRLYPHGEPDPSFGSAGIARVPLGMTPWYEGSTTIHRDGENLLVAITSRQGPSWSYSSSKMGVVRLDSSGQLDATFGSAGIALIDVGNAADSNARGLAIFPQTYVLAGSSNSRTVAVRLNKGTADGLFRNGFE